MASTDPYNGEGKLIVRALTAGGALPVEGANVTGFGADTQNKEIYYQFFTDSSGQTEAFILPTPAKSLSQSPGKASPYATYNIVVEREGFFSIQALLVPVFSEITSIQTVDMIPKGYANTGDYPRNIDQIRQTEPFQGG